MTQQLRQVIQIGWPEERKELPACLMPYFSCRDELAIYDGLVFKGERLIVLKAMRASMKERLHSSHIGVNGCLRRARECLFWPGMTSEIKEFISQCESCCMYDNKQQRETLMNYFSGFWEIDPLTSDCKAPTVIKKLKAHFARHGIPDVVISDNGPQFYCEEFAAFTKSWVFEHRTGRQGHQQSNGKAEASVKQAKKLIRKAKSSREDIYLGLLAVRNTPTESMGSSPAQRLLGRRCKTRLPTTRGLLRPQTVSTELIKKQTKEQQQRQAKYYDRGARDLQPLDEGDVVRMRPFRLGKKEWDRATVRKRLDERSYEIETDDGTTLRRNHADIWMQQTPSPEDQSPVPVATVPGPDPPSVSSPAATSATEKPPPSDKRPETPARPRRITREPVYLKDYVRR
ncbi:uncharacterized protein K02A2.6-like [Nematostella vectensis]|uniref:uncharacterized protein K02A2.6-like n=1 Tax=Nematostella vectensis TaxID=45351 RepID=UPI002076E401|nr:uncharacterized protein K02A2.6-like [Nematostella vectensis]